MNCSESEERGKKLEKSQANLERLRKIKLPTEITYICHNDGGGGGQITVYEGALVYFKL